jgi:chromosome partitioning protein
MSHVYAFANQKGGVGKTTTAVNLGAYLAARDKRVLLIDLDPQANATSSLGFDKRAAALSTYDALINETPLPDLIELTKRVRLDLAPSAPALSGAEVELVALPDREQRLKRAIEVVRANYDYVLIDCPPSLGLLTVNALVAAQGVIVPVQCEYLALEGLTRLTQTIGIVRKSLNPKLVVRGMLMTMFDGRARLSQQVVAEVRRHFADRVFQTVVPRSVRLGEAPSYGEPILSYAPSSPGGLAYAQLADELLAGDNGTQINADEQEAKRTR